MHNLRIQVFILASLAFNSVVHVHASSGQNKSFSFLGGIGFGFAVGMLSTTYMYKKRLGHIDELRMHRKKANDLLHCTVGYKDTNDYIQEQLEAAREGVLPYKGLTYIAHVILTHNANLKDKPDDPLWGYIAEIDRHEDNLSAHYAILKTCNPVDDLLRELEQRRKALVQTKTVLIQKPHPEKLFGAIQFYRLSLIYNQVGYSVSLGESCEEWLKYYQDTFKAVSYMPDRYPELQQEFQNARAMYNELKKMRSDSKNQGN